MTRTARILTIVIALVAASLLAVAVEGAGWWSTSDVSIGTSWSSRCFGGTCERVGLDWVGGGNGAWMRVGVATWGAGLVGAACLIALAAALASKKSGRLLARVVISAALAAGAVGALFVARYPGQPGMSLDIGAFLYFGGVAVALGAALWILRASRDAGAPGGRAARPA